MPITTYFPPLESPLELFLPLGFLDGMTDNLTYIQKVIHPIDQQANQMKSQKKEGGLELPKKCLQDCK